MNIPIQIDTVNLARTTNRFLKTAEKSVARAKWF